MTFLQYKVQPSIGHSCENIVRKVLCKASAKLIILSPHYVGGLFPRRYISGH